MIILEEENNTEEANEPQQEGRSGGGLMFAIVGIVFIVILAVGYLVVTKFKSTSLSNTDHMQTGDSQMQTETTPTSSVTGDVTDAMQKDTMSTTNSNYREISIDGSNFRFVPNSFTVSPGENIKLTFKDNDGFHSLVFDNLDINLKAINAGTSESTEFTAPTTPGSYTFYCNVDGHREKGMVGTMIVQ